MSWLHTFLLIALVRSLNGFFFHIDHEKAQLNQVVVENLTIVYPGHNLPRVKSNLYSRERFPNEFEVDFNEFNHSVRVLFVRSSSDYDHHDRIFIDVPESHDVVQYRIQNNEEFAHYKQLNGDGFATLIRNSPTENSEYRMMGTIFSDLEPNVCFNILPGKYKRSIEKRQQKTDDGTQNFVYVAFRELYDPNLDIYLKKNKIKLSGEKIRSRPKRQASASPLSIYIETLIVTDLSIYHTHARVNRGDTMDQTFQEMRMYYAYLMNGVSQRYFNSFANDPDLRINVLVADYLFLTEADDCKWANSSLVGDRSSLSYKNKPAVVSNLALGEFVKFMNSKNLTFKFDYAMGFMNKYIINSDKSQSLDERVQTGYSKIKSICTNRPYSIVSDFGGFSNIIAIAKELAHVLGVNNDGPVSLNGFLNNCPSDNYILSPHSSLKINPLNLLRLSNCSVQNLKSVLMNSSTRELKPAVTCLRNKPVELREEFKIINNSYAGYYWTAQDQCAMIYGPEATFCIKHQSTICTALYCRQNNSVADCIAMPGGAFDGTVCGSGRVCTSGQCVMNDRAPESDCPFGDGLVDQSVIYVNLKSRQLTCSEAFELITASNQSISGYCLMPEFNRVCCQSCKKYNSLKCYDQDFRCPTYRQKACNIQVPSTGNLVNTVCNRSCGLCESAPLSCQNKTFICQNGGACLNVTTEVSPTSFFAFKCQCPIGYRGELCEIVDPCLSSPCNDGVCVRLGSLGYTCICNNSSLSAQNDCKPFDSPVKKPDSIELTSSSSNIEITINQTSPINTTMPNQQIPCLDYNVKFCKKKATPASCRPGHFANGVPMQVYCGASCNRSCKKKLECSDSNTNCGSMRQFCYLLIHISPHPCRKTCQVCPDEADLV